MNYIGTIVDGDHQVRVDGSKRLRPRFDLRNHSPTGFCWGYEGSGPAQLALAILAHHADDETAQRWYHDFKHKVIARLDMDKGFTLAGGQVDEYLAEMHAKYDQGEKCK